jgi:hypothetical protein
MRILTNAVAAGTLATGYILLVMWQLNPEIRLGEGLLPLMHTAAPLYGPSLTAFFYFLLLVRHLFARDPMSPAWVSVGVLAWLCALAALGAAALTWANLRSFSAVLPVAGVGAMRMSAAALALASLSLLFVAIWHRRVGREGRWIRAAVLGCLVIASVAVPIAVTEQQRGTAEEPVELQGPETRQLPLVDRTARLSIIAVDAGSLEIVASAAAEGRLPNFGRLLDSGSVMDLATLRPTSTETVWTAVATGKLPQKNGIYSPALYRTRDARQILRLLPDYTFASGLVRFGLLDEEAHTSGSVASRTLWNILNSRGVTTGVVNWPLTYPALPVDGFVVTDLHVRSTLDMLGLEDAALVYPPPVRTRTVPIIREASQPSALPSVFGSAVLTEREQLPARIDHVHDRLVERLSAEAPPQVTIVRYESLDPIGHDFLRYAMPSRFGNVTEDDLRRFGGVLESHYGIIDEAIGRAIDRLGPDDLLLVVSAYGMEPLSTGKRLVEQLIGDPDVSGTHENAPDGFLMGYGAAVEPGRQLTRASVVDVVPTVLYFLGLPVARDMDGFARTALFRSTFTDERPITYIPSYEEH